MTEALGIDFVQLTEARKRELGRDIDCEEKLQLLQEVVKQSIRQFRDATKREAKVPSGHGASERTPNVQGSIRQTLICEYKQRADNDLSVARVSEPTPKVISSEHNDQTGINPPKKSNEMRSTQLTLFMMPRESTYGIKSSTTGAHCLEPKSRFESDLSSFLELAG